MLNTIEYSEGAKLGRAHGTYRAGKDNPYATCPNDCPLKPEDWQGTDEFDIDYMSDLSKAVPRRGWAWTYSHFAVKLWRHLNGAGRTVINASCKSIQEAIDNTLSGVPSVLDVPPDTPKVFKEGGVRFITCPAAIRKDITCNNCGGINGPLCARLERNYVITFPWHGTKGTVNKMLAAQKGICYGVGYFVNKHWRWLSNQDQDNITDGQKLLAWTKTLAPGSRLRHHVVGDGGKE